MRHHSVSSHRAFPSERDERSDAGRSLHGSSQEDLLFLFLPAAKRLARQVGAAFHCPEEESDLVSASLEGLLAAYQELPHIDPSKQKAFLRTRMYAAMIRTVRQLDHLSRAERRALERLQRSQEVLEARLGRSVDSEDLARELGLREDLVQSLRARLEGRGRASAIASPGAPMIDHVSTGGVVSEVLDPDGKDPLAVLLSAENTLLIEQALDRLPEREYDAVVATFYDGCTLKQVGSMLGVTEARASQLRTTGLRRMRKFLQRFQ